MRLNIKIIKPLTKRQLVFLYISQIKCRSYCAASVSPSWFACSECAAVDYIQRCKCLQASADIRAPLISRFRSDRKHQWSESDRPSFIGWSVDEPVLQMFTTMKWKMNKRSSLHLFRLLLHPSSIIHPTNQFLVNSWSPQDKHRFLWCVETKHEENVLGGTTPSLVTFSVWCCVLMSAASSSTWSRSQLRVEGDWRICLTTSVWTQNKEVSLWLDSINRSEDAEITTSWCKKSELVLCPVCRPDDKQTTFKMIVPWMEFRSIRALLCWDILPWLTRKSDFLAHFPPQQSQNSQCVIIQLCVSANRHDYRLLSSLPLMYMNIWISATLTSWCQCECQTGPHDTASQQILAWAQYFQLIPVHAASFVLTCTDKICKFAPFYVFSLTLFGI